MRVPIALAALPVAALLTTACGPAEEVAPEVEAAESRPQVDMEGMEDWAFLLGHNTPYELPTDWKGNANGLHTLWHDNGTKKGEGAFRDSKKVGPWTFWHDNGEKRWEGTYADDVPTGLERAWYEDGTPHYEGSYTDGLRQGSFSYWYPSGRLWWKGTFDKGKREGLFVQWTSTGEVDVEESGLYRRGEKIAEVDPAEVEAEALAGDASTRGPAGTRKPGARAGRP